MQERKVRSLNYSGDTPFNVPNPQGTSGLGSSFPSSGFSSQKIYGSVTQADLKLDVDWEHLHQISDNNPDFEVELLQIFVTDALARLQDLRRAIVAINATEIARMAHHIKGAGVNVGLQTIHELAFQLEQCAKKDHLNNNDLTLINQLVAQLQSAFDHLQAWISKAAET